MKAIFRCISAACLLMVSSVNCIWDPFSMHIDLLNFDVLKLSFDTDFNLGYTLKHSGEPSQYSELSDEFQLSINFKQWLKINVNLFDDFIESRIFELTWFEVMPMGL